MGEKTTKYPFVSEGEMMFGKKVRVKSKDILGFRDFFTRKIIGKQNKRKRYVKWENKCIFVGLLFLLKERLSSSDRLCSFFINTRASNTTKVNWTRE